MKKLLLVVMVAWCGQLQAQTNTDTVASATNTRLTTATGVLSGTLTVPNGVSTCPVVLIIAGSGPTDRDGNSKMGVKSNSYRILADSLLQYGIASLRYDKRGIGESAAAMAKEDDIRFTTMADDAAAWIALLKKDKRFKSIIVAGHSEGSLVGMLAAGQMNADKYISIAGVGWPAAETLKKQLAAQPKMVQDLCLPRLDTLASGKLLTNPPQMLYNLFRPSIQPYLISWFQYDPAKEIAKLKMPVLIINGTTDIQVSTDDAIRLHQASKQSVLVLVEGMSHLLKAAPADRAQNIALYNTTPHEPVMTQLVQAIVQFIKKP